MKVISILSVLLLAQVVLAETPNIEAKNFDFRCDGIDSRQKTDKDGKVGEITLHQLKRTGSLVKYTDGDFQFTRSTSNVFQGDPLVLTELCEVNRKGKTEMIGADMSRETSTIQSKCVDPTGKVKGDATFQLVEEYKHLANGMKRLVRLVGNGQENKLDGTVDLYYTMPDGAYYHIITIEHPLELMPDQDGATNKLVDRYYVCANLPR
jgi:hypothetical protein